MGCRAGEVWNPEVIADRIRRGLDVIGATEGGILFRGPDYWEVLPPGNEGQVLLVSAEGLPYWGDAPQSFGLWTDFFVAQTIEAANVNYLHNFSQAVTPVTYSIAADGISLQFTFGGAGASVNYTAWIPSQLGAAVHTSQFSESIYEADNGIVGAITRGGWTVMNSGGPTMQSQTSPRASGYYLVTLGETNQFRIDKVVNATITVIVAAFTRAAVGSVVRFEADLSSPTSTVLNVWDDGVLIKTHTDSSSPLRYGLPGLWHREGANLKFLKFKEFRAGKLEFA